MTKTKKSDREFFANIRKKILANAQKANKFSADQKEIIKRLIETIKAVRVASNNDDLAARLSKNLDGERARATNLSDKLAGAVMDYVHSI